MCALVAPALLAGCSDKEKPADPGATAPVATDLSPVPVPAGLVAELTFPNPDATWKDARALIGGPAAFLPASFGGLLTSLLGMPIAVASEIDETLPAFGAVTSLPAEPRPRLAIGVHVKSGSRLVDQLTRGEAARFTATTDPASSVMLLEPKGTVKGPAVFGVLGNYLLIAREAADLTYVGPYVVRTMPSGAIPKEDLAIEVPEASLAGPIAKLFEERKAAMVSMGAALAPVVPVERTLLSLAEITPDLKRARVTIDLDSAWAHVRLAALPKEGGGPASRALEGMAVGDTAALRDLPEDSLVGVLVRETQASRISSAPAYASGLAGLMKVEPMPKEDRDALEAALRAVAEARGDWMAAGVSFGSTGPTGYAHGAVGDKGKLEKALKDLVELSKRASVKRALTEAGFKVTPKKTPVEGIEGEVQRVRIERLEAAEEKKPAVKGAPKPANEKKGKEPSPTGAPAIAASDVPVSIDFYYMVRDSAFFAAAGYDAKAGLTGVVNSPGKGGFGGVPLVKTALDGLGSEVSFALVVDPLRLVASRAGKPGAAQPAPVVLSTGKGTGDGALGGTTMWLRLDVAGEAVRELIKHRNALGAP